MNSDLGIGRSRVPIPSAFLSELLCVQPSKSLCASDAYTEDLTLREAVSVFGRSAGVSYQIVHQSCDVRYSGTLRRRKRGSRERRGGGRNVTAQTEHGNVKEREEEEEKGEKGEKEGELDCERSYPQLLPCRLIFREVLKGNFNSKQSLR
jgi:hypothetical protein